MLLNGVLRRPKYFDRFAAQRDDFCRFDIRGYSESKFVESTRYLGLIAWRDQIFCKYAHIRFACDTPYPPLASYFDIGPSYRKYFDS